MAVDIKWFNGSVLSEFCSERFRSSVVALSEESGPSRAAPHRGQLRTSRELLVMPLEVADGSCELVLRVVEYAVPVSQDAASAGIQWHPGLRKRHETELNVESGCEPVPPLLDRLPGC
jgi:hypothetical protein